MPTEANARLSRRGFLRSSAAAGAGLVLGFELGCSTSSSSGAPEALGGTTPPPAGATMNAFLRIAPDDSVTIVAKHVEMGQGAFTGLATILAEELDADWSQVRVEAAPADASRYGNALLGSLQATGSSTAMANSWQQLREAGAQARAMLVAAAAATWGVPEAEVTVERGNVRHPGRGLAATFGELAARAGALPPPPVEGLTFKDPSQYRLIGRPEALPRVDLAGKLDGRARFTLDVHLPGMLTALVARPPRFGGKVTSFDAAAAMAVRGVREVVEVPGRGVAVLADDYWAAKKGRDALVVEWDESGAERRGSAELFAAFRARADAPGVVVRDEGDAPQAIGGAVTVIEAEYELPYLAHAPMEPLDCVARMEGDRCVLTAGSQGQTIDQGAAAAALGVPPERVGIETLLAGGSFGRRFTLDGDIAYEAASILKAIGGRAPVKLVWSREDDIRGGKYRPMVLHRLRGGLDAGGNVVAWQHKIVVQSIFKGSVVAPDLGDDGVEPSMFEGASELPYAIPNLRVEAAQATTGVPVHWWRSVGHSHTAFATEAFLDELAAAAGRDPVALRRELLRDAPRERAVLELAAEKAGWGSPLPAGRARGVAVHKSFGSYVAQIAEISLRPDGLPKVERVVCAVDCGVAINPDNVRAQVEGGIAYGLGAALYDEITLEEGRVVQSNFHDYRALRIHDMPRVEVHIVPSAEPPTGIGEPGTPPIAPAVASAYRALVGSPVRRLPFRRALAGGAP
ncbi:MAG TPA: xanthine dehydrogenase family protein molybdopterin-binding subunit [Polyangiaceae bacterium]|nr:xanthine dehydrogenase family protein molybdopterin-binding subunit [Polyangiaceae bacterium]